MAATPSAKPQAPVATVAKVTEADAVVIPLAASSPAKGSTTSSRAAEPVSEVVLTSRTAPDASRETRRIEPAKATLRSPSPAPAPDATPRSARQQAQKPHIYVAPRAPDDPGPEREEEGRAELVRHLKGRH